MVFAINIRYLKQAELFNIHLIIKRTPTLAATTRVWGKEKK